MDILRNGANGEHDRTEEATIMTITNVVGFLKKHVHLLAILLVSLLVTIIWFKTGKQIASGEESLSIFNTRDIWPINGFWAEVGLGFPNPTYLPRIPVSYFVTFLSFLHFPMWSIQAITFFLFIVAGILSMYFVTSKILKRDDTKNTEVCLFTALFYFFNLYAMSQIWGRFLYAAIALWSYIPLFLYLWIRWIEDRKYRTLFYIALSTNIFSLAFVQPANPITLVFPPLVWTIFELVKKRHVQAVFWRIIIGGILGLAVFIGANLWWIYPYSKIGNETFQSADSENASLESLRGVSQYFKVGDILQLRQSFLLGKTTYSGWYDTPLSVVLIWSIALIVAIGIFYLINNRKENTFKYSSYTIALLIIGLFISKGSNPPLGEAFFRRLFTTIPVLQVFRNPYEKFGNSYLLAYTLLFGVGITYITEKSKARWSNFTRELFISILIIIPVWPIWTGDLFGSQQVNTRVSVPESYNQANYFINKERNNGRILIMPILPGDGIQLDWEGGIYSGVEPGEYIFDKPILAKTYRTRGDKKYLELYESVKNGQPIKSLLEEMNIKYIILRNDLYNPPPNMQTPSQSMITIKNEFPDVENKKFSKLEVFNLNINTREIISQGTNVPKIEYKKLSPEHYIVQVTAAENPYSIILKQSFSSHWRAFINGKKVKDHQEVYNYANAWKIKEKGNYSIEIKFQMD
jgi:hypothetical protein